MVLSQIYIRLIINRAGASQYSDGFFIFDKRCFCQWAVPEFIDNVNVRAEINQ